MTGLFACINLTALFRTYFIMSPLCLLVKLNSTFEHNRVWP